MAAEETTRRDLLHSLGALSVAALLRPPSEAAAQTPAGTPGKVDTKGLTAKIKYESVVAGYLGDLNGKYKLRVTELVLEPGGYVGEHHHAGPGIRQVTSGYMTYVLPDKTLVYGPGVRANFLALMRAVARGWPLPLASVDNRRSLIYVGNLVQFLGGFG